METPHEIAAELAEIIKSTPSFLRDRMARAYERVNTTGQQQAVLDALPDFGVTAGQALTLYATMQGTLNGLGMGDGLAPADLTVFVPQQDGTVLYVAPPAPEPAP